VTQKEQDRGTIEAGRGAGVRASPSAPPTCWTTPWTTGKFTASSAADRDVALPPAETLAELALALIQEFDAPRVRVRLRKLHVPVQTSPSFPRSSWSA
jgi:hypothetical protein